MINLASPPSASSYSLLSIRSEKRNRSPTHSGPSTKRKPLATITGSSPGLMIASMAGSSRSTPVIFASGAASAAGFAPVSGAAGEQAARARPDTKARPIMDFMCRYSSCHAGPATAAHPQNQHRRPTRLAAHACKHRSPENDCSLFAAGLSMAQTRAARVAGDQVDGLGRCRRGGPAERRTTSSASRIRSRSIACDDSRSMSCSMAPKPIW